MNISVLLRLLREPLACGRLIGQVEVVDTGETALVHDEQELIAYLRDQARARSGTPATDRRGIADEPYIRG